MDHNAGKVKSTRYLRPWKKGYEDASVSIERETDIKSVVQLATQDIDRCRH